MARASDRSIDPAIPRSIWRVRRRKDKLEAWIQRTAQGWELSFLHNIRLLVSRTFPTERAARAEARRQLQDLERAGWTQHW